MLRGILFDFNGVLIDDEPLHFELFREVLAEEGVALTEETYYREYVGFDDVSAFRYALPDADEASVARLGARKATYYRERIRSERYPFFSGAVELVRQAAERDLVLGIVSGALRSEIEPALRQEGIEDLFKVVVAAEDVTEAKPHPDGYQRGVRELNTQPPLPARLFHPHEVLAIEDTLAGLEAARDAGLATLGVAHTHSEDDLGLADATAPSLDRVVLDDLLDRFAEVSRR